MNMKHILTYQAQWEPQRGKGVFAFTYFDGERFPTPYLDAEDFSIILDILRNEKPVYGEHETGRVTTQREPVGEEES